MVLTPAHATPCKPSLHHPYAGTNSRFTAPELSAINCVSFSSYVMASTSACTRAATGKVGSYHGNDGQSLSCAVTTSADNATIVATAAAATHHWR